MEWNCIRTSNNNSTPELVDDSSNKSNLQEIIDLQIDEILGPSLLPTSPKALGSKDGISMVTPQKHLELLNLSNMGTSPKIHSEDKNTRTNNETKSSWPTPDYTHYISRVPSKSVESREIGELQNLCRSRYLNIQDNVLDSYDNGETSSYFDKKSNSSSSKDGKGAERFEIRPKSNVLFENYYTDKVQTMYNGDEGAVLNKMHCANIVNMNENEQITDLNEIDIVGRSQSRCDSNSTYYRPSKYSEIQNPLSKDYEGSIVGNINISIMDNEESSICHSYENVHTVRTKDLDEEFSDPNYAKKRVNFIAALNQAKGNKNKYAINSSTSTSSAIPSDSNGKSTDENFLSGVSNISTISASRQIAQISSNESNKTPLNSFTDNSIITKKQQICLKKNSRHQYNYNVSDSEMTTSDDNYKSLFSKSSKPRSKFKARTNLFDQPYISNSSKNNSSLLSGLNTTTDANVGCFASIIEGRGNARGEVGIAFISISNPTLIISQFSDTRTYVRTKTKLAVFNPSDVLIPNFSGSSGAIEDNQFVCGEAKDKSFNKVSEGSNSSNKLYEVIVDQCPDSNTIQVHRKYFNETRGLQVVRHLCAPEFSSVELQLQNKYYGLAAANALLKYVEYIQNMIYASKSLRIVFQTSENTTMIDAETAKHVELLSSSFNVKSNNCLLGILKRSMSTPGGVRYLRTNLFQPPSQYMLIEKRLNVVEELINKPEIQTGLQATLSRFCDVDKLLALCVTLPKQETISSIEQKINNVIGLKHALELIPLLHTTLLTAESEILVQDCREILQDSKFVEMLTKIQEFIHDEAKVIKGSHHMKLQRCFAVKGGINGLLDVARRTYCEIVDDIETTVRQLSEEHGIPLRIGFNAQRGYHVQINNPKQNKPSNRKTIGANLVPKLKISDLPKTFLYPQSNKNTITFTTQSIIKADAKSQDALREITMMSNVIISELLEDIRSSIGCLYKLSEVVCVLDMFVALADISSQSEYVRPSFQSNTMNVEQARHPILEHLCLYGGRFGHKKIVANDIMADENANFHVLSGTNMAGKSTYLKQVVLLQIMAQLGCFVPAKEGCTFRICDIIFSRVGTSDNLECNASTFMLEMKEISYILSNLGTPSLVIIDELGRGTSPEEGTALCWAIAERLLQTPAYTFLTTHFSLLPQLTKMYPNVRAHCFLTEPSAIDNNSQICQTHKLVSGSLNENEGMEHYGLQLAKLSSLPRSIIDRAEQIAVDLESNSSITHSIEDADIHKLNCLELMKKLKDVSVKVRSRLDGKSPEEMTLTEKMNIINYCRKLQNQFADED